jgi:uncharacterized phage protein (TIGR02218 family)
MKTVSAPFSNHLNQEVTTLCTCWRIERKDGNVYGFTSHDRDLTINGIVYDSAYGYTKTAIQSSSDMSVDNLDITGVLDSDQIDIEDLRNGLFDMADVFVFLINWSDVTQGEMSLRRGWFGEVTVAQNGMFHAELRGLNQALSHVFVESFTPECRADFCDARCKLKKEDYTVKGLVYAATPGNRIQFTTTGIPDVTVSGSVGAHRNWRVFLVDVADGKHGGFAEFKFWDQSGKEITGGTPYASSEDKNHGAKKARDSSITTNWSTDTDHDDTDNLIEGAWWSIQFPTAVDVGSFAMLSTKNYNESPTTFLLQYTVENDKPDNKNKNLNWRNAKTASFRWTSGGQTAVFSMDSDTADPINYTDGQTTLPGGGDDAEKSRYAGGLVTFTTGQNANRAMEISDYDDETGVVTLFTALGFPISVGDTFDMMQACDKTKQMCVSYNNMLNFRGEPDVPGQDEFLNYPNSPS